MANFAKVAERVLVTEADGAPDQAGCYLDEIMADWDCELEVAVDRLLPARRSISRCRIRIWTVFSRTPIAWLAPTVCRRTPIRIRACGDLSSCARPLRPPPEAI